MENETWLSVEEVANLLDISKQAVQKNCAAGKYLVRQVSAKGGKRGWKYAIALACLPKKAQAQYLKKTSIAFEAGQMEARKLQLSEDMRTLAEQKQCEQSLLASQNLTGNGKARDEAHHFLIQAMNTYIAATHKKAKKGVFDFAAAYNRGEIEVPPEVRAIVPNTSPATLYRWQRDIKKGKHLGGQYGHRKGSGKIDSQPEIREFILGLLVDKPQISVKLLHDGLCARFSARSDLELPAKRSLERWVATWKDRSRELYTAITNPDAWKNEFMAGHGDLDADAPYVNAKWEIDSTPADLMLTDGRYVLIGIVEVYSRRGKLLVAKSSKATAVALAIRRALLDWGVPERIKGDNGQEYVSAHLARVASALGTRLEFSDYFSPWQKGHIERFFRTFSHGLASLLPGFIGHNVADRKAIEARHSFSERLFKKDEVIEIKMDAAQLQKFCDDWCENIYHHEAHGGLKGKTPFQRAAECREPLRYIENERVLDLLLAEMASGDGLRTVQKKGILIDGDYYDAPELERYRRQKVQVLHEPSDLGRVIVYGQDRPEDPLDPNAVKPGLHFIGIAECPARLGITREEHAAKAAEIKQRQKERVQAEQRKLRNLIKKVGTDTIADEIMEDKRKQAAAKLYAFPKKKIEHRTAGIAAAQEALDALDNAGPALPSYDDLEALRAKTAAKPKVERMLFDSAFERALWLAEVMMGTIQTDIELSGEDHEFMRDLRRMNPTAYRLADDFLNTKYRDKWDDYSAFRRAVGWPEARRPRG